MAVVANLLSLSLLPSPMPPCLNPPRPVDSSRVVWWWLCVCVTLPVPTANKRLKNYSPLEDEARAMLSRCYKGTFEHFHALAQTHSTRGHASGDSDTVNCDADDDDDDANAESRAPTPRFVVVTLAQVVQAPARSRPITATRQTC